MDRINKKQIVREVLRVDPKAREDDPYLYLQVAKRLELDHLNTYDLLLRLDYPAVVRARRFIQQHNEELRGKNYWKRQAYMAEYKKTYKPDYRDRLKSFISIKNK